jgi:hypothetical protein
MKNSIIALVVLMFSSLFLNSQEISQIYPNNAHAGQTLHTRIVGNNTDFLQSDETYYAILVYKNNYYIYADNYNVISNTVVDLDFIIPENSPQGLYSLKIIDFWSWNEGYVLEDCFIVHSNIILPEVDISPDFGNAGQTLDVSISGTNTHFLAGSSTSVDFSFDQGSGTTVINSLEIISNTSILANISIPNNLYTGDYELSVYNSIDGNMLDIFHIIGLQPPTLQSVNPSSANAGQTLNVSFSGMGTHFTDASSTYIQFDFDQGSATIINSIDVVSNYSMLANISVPQYVYSGYYDVSVYNQLDGVLTLEDGFYVEGQPVPSLVSINPSSANTGQTLNVSITGTGVNFNESYGLNLDFNFYQNSATTVVNSLDVVSENSLLANITIPENLYTGDYDVYVSDYWFYKLFLNNAFHVYGNTPPSLSNIAPSTANAGQSINLNITGENTHFSEATGTYVGFSSYECGDFILINSIVTTNNNEMLINVEIPEDMNSGTYDLYVYNDTDKLMILTECLQVNATGTEIFNKDNVKVYPNPTNDILHIEADNLHVISISNIEGKLLKKISVSGNKLDLDFSNYKTAVYLIKIETDYGTIVEKVIKY